MLRIARALSLLLAHLEQDARNRERGERAHIESLHVAFRVRLWNLAHARDRSVTGWRRNPPLELARALSERAVARRWSAPIIGHVAPLRCDFFTRARDFM